MVAGDQTGEESKVMKSLLAIGIVAATVLLSSCASHGPVLVLDPVGPAPSTSTAAAPTGTLMVFSAFEQGADFNSQLYRRHYTDYRILSADGKRLQTVRNDSGSLVETPQQVQLPVGTYRVVARANGYGEVTIPVVIRADQVTTVHLEGSPSWPNRRQLAGSNPVRLPDGEIAGWRAGNASGDRPSVPQSNRWQP
jgi:hypothetical protein